MQCLLRWFNIIPWPHWLLDPVSPSLPVPWSLGPGGGHREASGHTPRQMAGHGGCFPSLLATQGSHKEAQLSHSEGIVSLLETNKCAHLKPPTLGLFLFVAWKNISVSKSSISLTAIFEKHTWCQVWGACFNYFVLACFPTSQQPPPLFWNSGGNVSGA